MLVSHLQQLSKTVKHTWYVGVIGGYYRQCSPVVRHSGVQSLKIAVGFVPTLEERGEIAEQDRHVGMIVECELHRPLRVCDGGIQIGQFTTTLVPHVCAIRETFEKSHAAVTSEDHSALDICDGIIQITTPSSVVVACL
jgi:hypothetical protein